MRHRVYLATVKGRKKEQVAPPEEYLEADPDELEALYGREPDEHDMELIVRLADKPEVARSSV